MFYIIISSILLSINVVLLIKAIIIGNNKNSVEIIINKQANRVYDVKDDVQTTKLIKRADEVVIIHHYGICSKGGNYKKSDKVVSRKNITINGISFIVKKIKKGEQFRCIIETHGFITERVCYMNHANCRRCHHVRFEILISRMLKKQMRNNDRSSYGYGSYKGIITLSSSSHKNGESEMVPGIISSGSDDAREL